MYSHPFSVCGVVWCITTYFYGWTLQFICAPLLLWNCTSPTHPSLYSPLFSSPLLSFALLSSGRVIDHCTPPHSSLGYSKVSNTSCSYATHYRGVQLSPPACCFCVYIFVWIWSVPHSFCCPLWVSFRLFHSRTDWLYLCSLSAPGAICHDGSSRGGSEGLLRSRLRCILRHQGAPSDAAARGELENGSTVRVAWGGTWWANDDTIEILPVSIQSNLSIHSPLLLWVSFFFCPFLRSVLVIIVIIFLVLLVRPQRKSVWTNPCTWWRRTERCFSSGLMALQRCWGKWARDRGRERNAR